jgi:hypothetical protein
MLVVLTRVFADINVVNRLPHGGGEDRVMVWAGRQA